MSLLNEEIFKDLLELIPEIQKTTLKCVKKELSLYPHNEKRIVKEINTFKPILKLFKGKYIFELLYLLFISEGVHYNNLLRVLDGISSRTLSNRLKRLEELNVIKRKILDTKPLSVEYKMTKYGKGLAGLIAPLILYAVYGKGKDIQE